MLLLLLSSRKYTKLLTKLLFNEWLVFFFFFNLCGSESLSLFLCPFWEVGRTVCGVTITRSNVSRMDPNRKMLCSEHVSPSGQGRISESLIKSPGLVPLKDPLAG